MRTGLYFGTFNPIHIGHIIIANHVLENTDLGEVWLVVTPQSPHKVKKNLLDDYDRLEMVYRAVKPYYGLRECDIEFRLTKPNYTTHTLAHLKDKYPSRTFALIMGSDNILTLHKWKNYEVITSDYDIFVYPRCGHTADSPYYKRINTVDAPIIELSSSLVREQIRMGHSIRHLMPDGAWQYLDKMGFYKL